MTRETDEPASGRAARTSSRSLGRSTSATAFFPGAIKGPLGSAPRLIANWPLNIIAAHKSEAAGHFRFPFSPFPRPFNY